VGTALHVQLDSSDLLCNGLLNSGFSLLIEVTFGFVDHAGVRLVFTNKFAAGSFRPRVVARCPVLHNFY
jgi:hypothetical protein